MKKWGLFLGLYFCFCLLAACGGIRDGALLPEEEPTCGPGVPYETTCRIVDGGETGRLLLADCDGSAIYTLDLSGSTDWQPDTPLQNGQLLTIRYQSVLETWPSQFHQVSQVLPSDTGLDNRAALYLQVLEALWERDGGLNQGVEYIGLDLSQTSLSPAEQSAVSWAFASRHGAEALQATWQDLVDQEWITATPLTTSGAGVEPESPTHYFYEWENGCHFSIVEQTAADQPDSLLFDAQKWRSSLGAYFFSNCTASQAASGLWDSYQIGSEMIS